MSVEELGATPIPVELTNRDAMRDVMAGCSVGFHVAGVNTMCPRRVGEMFLVNVAGTRRVVEAAARAGVSRVVLTSSVTAGGSMTSAYARSKQLGEAAGFAAAEKHNIEAVAVRPASVQGPGRTEGSARLLIYLLRSPRPWVVDARFSIVDVDDCAESHLRAAQRGEPGAAYVVSGGTVTSREIAVLLADAVGREAHIRVVPRRVAALIGFLPALVGDLWPGDAPFCREALATVLTDHRHDGALAARELGFAYRPVGATLARAAHWYDSVGLL
jgi:dihydroflavonol-4-reductase